jgi:hypothetical protein
VRHAQDRHEPVVDERLDALADGGLGDLQSPGDFGVAEPPVGLEVADDAAVEGVGLARNPFTGPRRGCYEFLGHVRIPPL